MATYAITTRATLRTRVRERLINSFWTDTELNDLINEGLRMWGALTGFYRQRSTISFATNQADYDVSSAVATDCFAVLRIDLALRHLDPITIEELGQFSPTWQIDSSTTTAGINNWIPLGLNKIALYPLLGVAAGTLTAYVDNLYFAPIPGSDGAYIQLGEEDMNALIDYVQFAAVVKEGGQELQDATRLLTNFLAQAAKYNSRLQKSATFRRILGMPGGGQRNTRPKDMEGLAPR